MYKNFKFDEICNVKSNFFSNLRNIYKSKGYEFLKEFIRDAFKEGYEIYFFESNTVTFKISKDSDGNIIFNDEKDKIQLIVDNEELQKLHNIMKDNKKINNIKTSTKSIMKELMDKFANGELSTINNKPFLVYDIETVGDINNLKTMKFKVGYSVVSSDSHKSNIAYKYVSEENLKKFVDFMLDFDGYIIGYNHIYFDNPVVCYNMGYSNDIIQELNNKSLDLFMFLWNITGKRMGLNKVAQALVSVGKTLDSGQEGENLLKEYDKTNDENLLKKVKQYCRNDVKMTLGVLLYLLYYQKIYIDNKDIEYSLDDIINLSQEKVSKKDKENKKNLYQNSLIN